MSSNMNYTDALGGLDDAEVGEGKFPPLEADNTHLVEIMETKFFQSKKDERLIWLQEVLVIESTCAAAVGKIRSDMIYDVRGAHKKLRMGQLKSQVAAILGYDPESDQKWTQIAVQMAEKNAVKGFRYVLKCGARTATSGNKGEYTPRHWSTPEAGKLGDKQKALFAKRVGN